MCFLNLWLLPTQCTSPEFTRQARTEAGVELVAVDCRVDSPKSAQFPHAFAIGRALCNCTSVIGERGSGDFAREAGLVRRWLDYLAQQLGRKARIGLLQTWSPSHRVSPKTVTSLPLHQVDGARLRALAEDELLVIRFSRW